MALKLGIEVLTNKTPSHCHILTLSFKPVLASSQGKFQSFVVEQSKKCQWIYLYWHWVWNFDQFLKSFPRMQMDQLPEILSAIRMPWYSSHWSPPVLTLPFFLPWGGIYFPFLLIQPSYTWLIQPLLLKGTHDFLLLSEIV